MRAATASRAGRRQHVADAKRMALAVAANRLDAVPHHADGACMWRAASSSRICSEMSSRPPKAPPIVC